MYACRCFTLQELNREGTGRYMYLCTLTVMQERPGVCGDVRQFVVATDVWENNCRYKGWDQICNFRMCRHRAFVYPRARLLIQYKLQVKWTIVHIVVGYQVILQFYIPGLAWFHRKGYLSWTPRKGASLVQVLHTGPVQLGGRKGRGKGTKKEVKYLGK
jgi:hypothetical protein